MFRAKHAIAFTLALVVAFGTVGVASAAVQEGPGINDSGSGTATDLEVALQMSTLGIQPRNKVRFAFWGAEESGLIGSQYYVDSLTKRQPKNIAVHLNFDMVGSPNYVRFVCDGDASDTDSLGSTGSGVVEDVFNDYFASQGLATEPTAFDGRSDYDAFVSAGIPAGGLFTGAEDIKSAREARIYGGVSGVAYDPCYHGSCDSLTPVADGADPATYSAIREAYSGKLVGNLNTRALREMSDAVAHGTVTFAQTTSAVNGTDKGSGTASTTAYKYKGSHLQK